MGITEYDGFNLNQYTGVVAASRAAFASRINQIVGASNVRLLITPARADTTTTVDLSVNARTVTWDATIAARLDQAGLGETQTFNGTNQVGTVPDAANLSFGNSTTDSPFSIVAVVNVTDTALYREIIAKYSSVNGSEWGFEITAADMLQMHLSDNSASTPGANPARTSNAAITQGSVQMFAGVYTAATGRATAGNDITLYVADASIASTARNEAAYVAMEDTFSPVVVGAIQTATYDQLFSGSILLTMVVAGALSVAQLTAIKTAVNEFFGLSL